MRISLFGVGHVGSVCAACLARDGHVVTAVDLDLEKLERLRQGRSPILEPGLEALIQSGVNDRRLHAVASISQAVATTDLSLICVDAPSAPDGTLDMTAVERVVADIGRALIHKPQFHVVAVRSTLTPGGMAARIAPALEQASSLKVGVKVGLAYYPAFLRQGAAIADYDDPSLVVMAATDDETLTRLRALQPQCAVSPMIVSLGEAEAIKAVSNAWRGVKISFANEMGGVLGALDIDSHRVMAAVSQERGLNSFPAYFKPGFAFGGSGLPKDLRAFSAVGKAVGRQVRMLDAAVQTNRDVIDHAVALVETAGRRRISIIGLAFKPGTDDLRDSPYLLLAERLAAKGYDLRLFDPAISIPRLSRADLAYAQNRLPHLLALMCDSLDAAVRHGETLILAHPEPGAAALHLADAYKRVIDLVRVRPDLKTAGNYVGLSW